MDQEEWALCDRNGGWEWDREWGMMELAWDTACSQSPGCNEGVCEVVREAEANNNGVELVVVQKEPEAVEATTAVTTEVGLVLLEAVVVEVGGGGSRNSRTIKGMCVIR